MGGGIRDRLILPGCSSVAEDEKHLAPTASALEAGYISGHWRGCGTMNMPVRFRIVA
jgi:hypothetical protein